MGALLEAAHHNRELIEVMSVIPCILSTTGAAPVLLLIFFITRPVRSVSSLSADRARD